MFKLLPYYASASLAAVLATAALLMSFDREVDKPQARMGQMKELATLSGGVFTAASGPDGATLRAEWKRR